jgi:hypothetical protein
MRPGNTLVIAVLLGALLVAATLQFFFLSR